MKIACSEHQGRIAAAKENKPCHDSTEQVPQEPAPEPEEGWGCAGLMREEKLMSHKKISGELAAEALLGVEPEDAALVAAAQVGAGAPRLALFLCRHVKRLKRSRRNSQPRRSSLRQ